MHGVVLNPVRAAKLGWPILKAFFKAFCFGIGPVIILDLSFTYFAPFLVNSMDFLAPLGGLISAILLHRMFLAEISHISHWNIVISMWAVAQLAFIGIMFSVLQNSP